MLGLTDLDVAAYLIVSQLSLLDLVGELIVVFLNFLHSVDDQGLQLFLLFLQFLDFLLVLALQLLLVLEYLLVVGDLVLEGNDILLKGLYLCEHVLLAGFQDVSLFLFVADHVIALVQKVVENVLQVLVQVQVGLLFENILDVDLGHSLLGLVEYARPE